MQHLNLSFRSSRPNDRGLSNESGLGPAGKRFVLPLGAVYESPWKHYNQYVGILDAERRGFPPMIEIAYETGAAAKVASGGTLLARC